MRCHRACGHAGHCLTSFSSPGLESCFLQGSRKKRQLLFSGSDGKESACSVRDLCLIPELGRSSREGNDHPLQYSYLGNSMDRGTWRATVHRVTKSRTRLKWLNTHIHPACGILSLHQGRIPQPMHWEHRLLTSGLPGKSQKMLPSTLSYSRDARAGSSPGKAQY